MRNKRVGISTAIVLMGITVLCKFLGFVKNSVLAYCFGTGPIVDSYVMTFSIGTITCGWIAGFIGNFTPIFKKVEVEEGRDKAVAFSSKVLIFVTCIIVMLVIILGINAPLVVQLVAPGFDSVRKEYTIRFFRSYLISAFFYGIYRFFNEYLNCNQYHLLASLPDVLLSTCSIIAIVVSYYINENFLIYGYVIAVIIQSIVVTFFVKRIGFKFHFSRVFDANVKQLILMAIPIFMSNTLSEINVMVDKIFASKLESGVIASLDYANIMKEFALQIGTITLLTLFFPIVSKYWADKNYDSFKNSVLKSINIMTAIFIPITTVVFLVGDVVIRIVYQRGRFSAEDTKITTIAFIIYSAALVALAYNAVFLKAFYSMQETRNVLFVSLINVSLNIILNLILVKRWGYIGLSLATSLSSIMCTPFYFFIFKKKVCGVSYNDFIIKFVKIVSASSFAGFMLFVFRRIVGAFFMDGTAEQLFMLCIMLLLAIVCYIISGVVLDIEEIKSLLYIIREKFCKKSK